MTYLERNHHAANLASAAKASVKRESGHYVVGFDRYHCYRHIAENRFNMDSDAMLATRFSDESEARAVARVLRRAGYRVATVFSWDESIRRMRGDDVVYEKFVEDAEKRCVLVGSPIHGPVHWDSVWKRARELWGGTENLRIIAAFAAYHDCMRFDDNADPAHGERAAELVGELELGMSTADLRRLQTAIRRHPSGDTSKDATIGLCWDADRLDLIRLGIMPQERYLSTNAGLRKINAKNRL